MPTEQDLFAEERSMVAMSLGDHIEELRRHLILALLGLVAGIVVTVIPPLNLGRQVVRQMQEPAQRTLSTFYAEQALQKAAAAEAVGSYTSIPTRIPADVFARAVRQVFPDLPARQTAPLKIRYVELPLELKDSGLISAVEANVERTDSLIALGPMEPALIFVRVCFVTGLVLASPWVFYQVWAFIAAGLYRHERASLYKYLPYSLVLFLAGVFLCFFAVLPLTLRFLLEFNVWLGVKPMLRLSEWMGFATILPLVFGLCFQTPLVMLFLAMIGIFTASDYRAKRRLAFLIIIIVAALLTPGPDVVSMLLLSVPMALLYELGILLVGEPRPAAVG
ncbi:twin-arginine translocase subunit TatC [Singulisphaera sp. Ch08]|uniref:Sec-independent protein translocase protein TatC n=1 Tax=Singulisphaera sp. Ch08 TaxID=3120278 RepID=A0AAU7CGI9_9BACT